MQLPVSKGIKIFFPLPSWSSFHFYPTGSSRGLLGCDAV